MHNKDCWIRCAAQENTKSQKYNIHIIVHQAQFPNSPKQNPTHDTLENPNTMNSAISEIKEISTFWIIPFQIFMYTPAES